MLWPVQVLLTTFTPTLLGAPVADAFAAEEVALATSNGAANIAEAEIKTKQKHEISLYFAASNYNSIQYVETIINIQLI